MDKSSLLRKTDIPNDTSPDKETNQIQIKHEPPDDIKDYAENTMNELLGWYGYDKVDEEDTQNLSINVFQGKKNKIEHNMDVRMRDSTSCEEPSDDEETESSIKDPILEMNAEGGTLQEFLRITVKTPSNSSLDDKEAEAESEDTAIVCAWCLQHGTKQFTLKTQQGVKAFCSDLCFNQCRRASFKKNQLCDWCKQVRPTVNCVDFQDGNQQLQFCNEKCLNQYKMNIFCKETQAHLQQIQAQVDAGNLPKPVKKSEIMITPELWVKDRKARNSVKPPEEMACLPENQESGSSKSIPNDVENPDENETKFISLADTYMSFKTKKRHLIDSNIPEFNTPECQPKVKHEGLKENVKSVVHTSRSPCSPQPCNSRQGRYTSPKPAVTARVGGQTPCGTPVRTSSRTSSSKSPVINSQLFRPPQHTPPLMNPFMFRAPIGVLPTFQPPYPVATPPHVSMILPVPMFIPMPIPIPIPIPMCPHMDHSSRLSENSDEENNLASSAPIPTTSEHRRENLTQSNAVDPTPESTEKTPLSCACCRVEKHCPSDRISINSNMSSQSPVSYISINNCSTAAYSSAQTSCDEVMDLSQDKFKVKEEPKDLNPTATPAVNANSKDPGLTTAPVFMSGCLPLPPPVDHAYSRRRGLILDAPPPPRDKSDSPPPDKRYCRRSNPRDIYTRKGNLRPRMRTK